MIRAPCPRESEQDCTAVKPPNPCLYLLWDGPCQVPIQGWLRNDSLDSGQEGSHWGHQPGTAPSGGSLPAGSVSDPPVTPQGVVLGKKVATCCEWLRATSPVTTTCWEGRDAQHQTGEGEHPHPSVGSVASQQELPSLSPVPRCSWQVTMVTTHCPFYCWKLLRFPSPLLCPLF